MKKGSVLKSSRLIGGVVLPTRVFSLTFHLEQPAGATEPAAMSWRCSVVARLQLERRVPLAMCAIRIEGVSHENAHAQN